MTRAPVTVTAAREAASARGRIIRVRNSLAERFRNMDVSLRAVSYTHLDVYKRQEETELPFDKAMEQAEKQIEVVREKVDRVGGELQLAYKSLIELQEEKLSKAREEFIKLKGKK